MGDHQRDGWELEQKRAELQRDREGTNGQRDREGKERGKQWDHQAQHSSGQEAWSPHPGSQWKQEAEGQSSLPDLEDQVEVEEHQSQGKKQMGHLALKGERAEGTFHGEDQGWGEESRRCGGGGWFGPRSDGGGGCSD